MGYSKHKSFFMLYMVSLIAIFIIAESKIVKKTINLKELREKHFMFITKFDFGIGENNITMKYRKINSDNTQLISTRIGLLIDDGYKDFFETDNCQEKQNIFKQTNGIKFYDGQHGTQIVRINQSVRQHLWFLYIYNCQNYQLKTPDQSQALQLQFILMNDGSHLGEDQKLLWLYIVVFAIWLLSLIFKLFMPMMKCIIEPRTETSKLIVFMGYLLLGLSVFYRVVNLVTTIYSGETIVIFDMLHGGFKNLAEGGVLTLLVSISWGWSLTHTNFPDKYKLIAVLGTGINIFCVILWHYNDQAQDTYHQYEEPPGVVVFFLRVVVGILFIFGCLNIKTKSTGKNKYFIQKFLKLGSIYIFSWPMAVILSQLVLPKYLHNEVVTIIEELSHIISNGYICWLFAHPESEYIKVSISEESRQKLP